MLILMKIAFLWVDNFTQAALFCVTLSKAVEQLAEHSSLAFPGPMGTCAEAGFRKESAPVDALFLAKLL